MSTGDNFLTAPMAAGSGNLVEANDIQDELLEKVGKVGEATYTGPATETSVELPEKPQTAEELVEGLPSDLVRRTEARMLQGEYKIAGHQILPLPVDFNWMNGAPDDSDVTYTFILEIVHRELKRFAKRLDKYFILVPKDIHDNENKEEETQGSPTERTPPRAEP
jgi:hypothetical protein